MARYAGRDRRVRYVLPVAVEVQLLLVDGNDDLQRTRGNIAEGPAADMLGRLLLVLGPAPVATPTVGLALSLLLPATIVVAVRLSDLPGRLVAVGAALPVRALFGRSTAVVAVGRPVVCSVRLYAAVAGIRVMAALVMASSVTRAAVIVIVRAIVLAMVPLGVSVSVAIASRLVLGATAFLAAALVGMLSAIAAVHAVVVAAVHAVVVAIVLARGERLRHGAGRGGEGADKPDCAERGKKAAPSAVERDESALRANSFQFQPPSHAARYRSGVNFR